MPPKRANRFWKYLRNFRKHQNGENGVCGTSASIKMEKMAFAELPQASKWRKWPLRDSHKHRNGENGSCGTSASVKMGKMALAELPQASKWGKWCLRNFRKHQNGENGPCGVPANAKKFPERLAGLPQTPKSFPRHLRGSRKRSPFLGEHGEEWYNENGRIPEGLRPTGTRPNLLAEPTYSVGMSLLTFFEPTRA